MALNTKTAQNVVDYVKRQFGDESGVQLIDSDIYRWIDQGQMEINSKNVILRSQAVTTSDKTVTITTSNSGGGDAIITATTDTYAKPIDCMRVTAIKFDNILLDTIGFDDYQLRYQGDIPTGQPAHWTQYGENIILAPSPDPNNIKQIWIYYIPEPLKITGGGSTLSLPDRYFDRLCEYVMSKAYELDEDWQAHSAQRNLMEKGLVDLSNEEVSTDGPYSAVVDYSYDMYGWPA